MSVANKEINVLSLPFYLSLETNSQEVDVIPILWLRKVKFNRIKRFSYDHRSIRLR